MKKNLANIITLTRIFFVFIVVGLLYCKECQYSYQIALFLTAILMWFDGLDGFVARKLNISSKLGSLLDIMGDRIVENVFWIAFCALGWVNVCVPIIVLTRGIVTDSLRTLAFEQGYTAFGAKTMMQGKIAKFIVASNFCRFTYAVCKAVAFFFLIAGNMPIDYNCKALLLKIGIICTIISVAFCVLRGLPVIVESKRFFATEEK
ncbi:MAG: CDP-alcohol phosphatidyltransferase family protein [Candidatus Gastranaerophilales bacterium]|nr:CDP-alcohol phosphatidyltransferase family protein [Candidatus Gastranaerophilales bacterium]